jgi:hypothetical protein
MDLDGTLGGDVAGEIDRLRGGEDKRDALAQLSKLFWKLSDQRYLWGCASLLRHFEDDLTYHNDAQWRMVASLAFGEEKGVPTLRDRILYEELGPSYLRVVNALRANCRFPPRPKAGPRPPRLLWIAHNVLGGSHSPTMVATEYCARLATLMGMDVMIMDSRLYPDRLQSDMYGLYWTLDKRPAGVSEFHRESARMLLYSAPEFGMSEAKLLACGRAALAFDPDWVVAHGHFNTVADLMAPHFPTVIVDTTRNEPVSLAPSYVLFDGIVRNLRMPATGLLPRTPRLFSLPSRLPVPDKTATFDRAHFGLKQEDFVYIVVGYRLAGEITEAFEAALARILDAVPNAVILTVGSARDWRNARLKGETRRLRHIKFEADLRALTGLCDCFLNPERQGGGMSGFLALHEAVPVLTLPDNDVAGVIGNENAVPDLDTLTRRAMELGRNPAAHEAARARMREMLAASPAFDDTIRAFVGILEETAREARADEAA